MSTPAASGSTATGSDGNGSLARYPGWILAPGLCWAVLFFFVPLLIVLAVSFASRGTYGGVLWTFSLTNYVNLLHPLYFRIFGRSIFFAAVTTALCLVLGFPLAYYIARLPRRRQGLWLVLVLIPFWTNFLVRTYAWMFILRTEGVINKLLMGAGLIDAPIELLYSDAAVLLGLVYGYLPFMVLPLYAAVERLDPALVEAACDLYASRWSVFRRVVLPLTKPGVIAGCLLVFMPSLGAFITPDLLGGARSMMVGNLIQHEYLVVRDWPLGSALSFVLMGVLIAAMAVYYRIDAGMNQEGSRR
ncbi:MAG TPA: ABC transporter permease [Nitrospiraceae bacterium]|nr:ABC transporter permease [Nitrospiraceae bacterium]